MMDSEEYVRHACPPLGFCRWCGSDLGVIKNGIFRCIRCYYECDVTVHPKVKVVGWTRRGQVLPDIEIQTHEVWQALVDNIREHGYRFSVYDHDREDGFVPVLNNGCTVDMGYRTFGHIMAEAHNEPENYHLRYILLGGMTEEEVLPEDYVDKSQIVPFFLDGYVV